MRLINKRKRSSSPQRKPHVIDSKLAFDPDVRFSTWNSNPRCPVLSCQCCPGIIFTQPTFWYGTILMRMHPTSVSRPKAGICLSQVSPGGQI